MRTDNGIGDVGVAALAGVLGQLSQLRDLFLGRTFALRSGEPSQTQRLWGRDLSLSVLLLVAFVWPHHTGNELIDIRKLVGVLSHLPHLHTLDLHGMFLLLAALFVDECALASV